MITKSLWGWGDKLLKKILTLSKKPAGHFE